MSQHPSLRVSSVGTKHRNVLKRHEKIKKLQEEDKWQENPSAFRLPKVKSVKIKVKKTKTEAVEGEGVEGVTTDQKPATQEIKVDKKADKK